MNKKIALSLLLCIFVIGWGGNAQAALYDYALDIQLLTGYSALPNLDKIGGIEFRVTGGSITSSSLGNAIPTSAGWILEPFGGGYYAVYDDFDPLNIAPTYNPITTGGNIFMIFSDVPLTFSDLGFYDQSSDYLTNGQYFSSAGFQQTAVPIPAAAWLLGSGLLGLVAIRRRMKK